MNPTPSTEVESRTTADFPEPPHLPTATSAPTRARRLFLDFVYAETKDVLKHYVTLAGATIALEAAFGEKLLNILHEAHPLTRGAFFVSVLLQFSALGNFALGLLTLLRAGELAKIEDLCGEGAEEWRPRRKQATVHLVGGVWAYWLGLATLAAAWVLSAL